MFSIIIIIIKKKIMDDRDWSQSGKPKENPSKRKKKKHNTDESEITINEKNYIESYLQNICLDTY
jgi:hypothetical protein